MDVIKQILNEISYKFSKGYPDLNNEYDINLIEEHFSKLLNENFELSEVALNPTQLSKPYYQSSEFYGKYLNRGKKFLEKIEKGEEFELNSGEKVIIDASKSQEAISFLKNGEYRSLGGGKKLFLSKDGDRYSLTDFKKTQEFGSGTGSGAGAATTSLAESSQCLVTSYFYNIGEDLNLENLDLDGLNKAMDSCDVTNTLEEMVNFIKDPSWFNTFINSAKLIKNEFPGKYEFHRGSSFVTSIYNAFKQAKKQEKVTLNDDKWNPADIWLVSPNIKDYEFPTEMGDLNNDILNLLDNKELIGVSLKKLSGEGKLTYNNTEESDTSTSPKIEQFKITGKSKGGEVHFDGSKIYFRTFNFATNFAGEIMGKSAAHGKIGSGPLNLTFKSNNLPTFPPTPELKNKIESKDEDFKAEFKNLFLDFISISDVDFESLYENSNIDWKISKYLTLFSLNNIKNDPSILGDILNYASSTSKFSSAFVKIS